MRVIRGRCFSLEERRGNHSANHKQQVKGKKNKKPFFLTTRKAVPMCCHGIEEIEKASSKQQQQGEDKRQQRFHSLLWAKAGSKPSFPKWQVLEV